MKKLYTFFLMLVLSSNHFAFSAGYKKEIFDLFINQQMNKWTVIIDSLTTKGNLDIQEKLDILGYYYGLIGHYLDTDQKNNATKALHNANLLLQDIEKKNPDLAELYGLKANFIGFQIALSPWKAPGLYRGMMTNANKAASIGSANPLALILYANILFYMPDVFGGDSEKALSNYQKALLLMQKNKSLTEENWLYIQLWVTIGLVNEKLGHLEEARKAFQTVMRLEPRYKHVKTVLYPRLLAKMGK